MELQSQVQQKIGDEVQRELQLFNSERESVCRWACSKCDWTVPYRPTRPESTLSAVHAFNDHNCADHKRTLSQ